MKYCKYDGFEVYREDPPKKINHGTDWDKRLDYIRALKKPGIWYVVGEFPGIGARHARTRLAKEFGDMEFRSHTDPATGTSKLYTRVPKQ